MGCPPIGLLIFLEDEDNVYEVYEADRENEEDLVSAQNLDQARAQHLLSLEVLPALCEADDQDRMAEHARGDECEGEDCRGWGEVASVVKWRRREGEVYSCATINLSSNTAHSMCYTHMFCILTLHETIHAELNPNFHHPADDEYAQDWQRLAADSPHAQDHDKLRRQMRKREPST